MSIEAKREYLNEIRERYSKSSKAQKTAILNEFCAVCGYNRSYASRILSGTVRLRKNKPGKKPIYGPEFTQHLNTLWLSMGRICSKKMKAAMPLWLPFYKDPGCTDQLRAQLLKISPASIDRLLNKYRREVGRGLSTTKAQLSWIKSRIPIELLHGTVTQPGFVEADTVAHCGNSTAGSYVNTLTMTDLYSGWTENRACFTKDALCVLEQIMNIEKTLPFLMLGFACDNGTEFLNESLLNYFQDRKRRPVKFVRRRPYKKNDAAHVEQKNFTHVRQIFGYERFEDQELVALMNEIYREYWNPLLNYFTPCLKLMEKTRIGGRIKKKYELPKTPYQRLLDSDEIYQGIKLKMKEYYSMLNPFRLREQLDQKLKIFFRLVEVKKASRVTCL